jgi:signal transduction histidine kinase
VNLVYIAHIAALLVVLALGLAVFWTNARRATNQFFLLLAVLASCWILALMLAFSSEDPAHIARFVSLATAIGSCAPLVVNYLRQSIASREEGLLAIVARSPLWLLVNLAIVGLCQTRFFLRGVNLPGLAEPYAIPEAVWGPGANLYGAYWIVSLTLLTRGFFRDLRAAAGIRRTELQFIILGGGLGLIVGVIPAAFVPMLARSSQSVQIAAPLAMIFLVGFTAYGIATRRIMDVAYFLRLVTAYGLVTVYLVVLYLAVWWPAVTLERQLGRQWDMVPNLLAALAVAFSVAPAHGWMQRFANRLFVHSTTTDLQALLKTANQLLRSIGTVEDLLARFTDLVTGAVGADRIAVLLAEDGHFRQRYPVVADEARTVLPATDSLVAALTGSPEPLVSQVVRRLRSTPVVLAACQRLDALRMEAAMPIQSQEGLAGIVLFGPRLSGRIYGAPEQQALQLLCNQLAVALHNSRLYTQLQDGKIYNDVLLDSLVSGVIAANNEGTVTVFNREAQRITRLKPEAVLGRPASILPDPLGEVLTTTLKQGTSLRDQEVMLGLADQQVPIRVGSSVFIGSAGRVLGAFLVYSDLTAIKKLELQIRRTDRLASLGTLSAGMAHEIKNPLVTIKTFTQLLPERYGDSDFRETFFSLIGTEVKRIDSIVNQLLRFSRPAKPHLTPTHLHEVLKNSLNLVTQQLRQKDIALECVLEANNDLIHADGDQLSQAFINFFLNAIESMSRPNGVLTVSTALLSPDNQTPGWWRRPRGNGRIQVSVRDTGDGIAPANLANIFDPFFTTKSQGTGLGLSVAHNIIQEHSGTIDVKSEVSKGTTFHVVLPLLEREEPV